MHSQLAQILVATSLLASVSPALATRRKPQPKYAQVRIDMDGTVNMRQNWQLRADGCVQPLPAGMGQPSSGSIKLTRQTPVLWEDLATKRFRVTTYRTFLKHKRSYDSAKANNADVRQMQQAQARKARSGTEQFHPVRTKPRPKLTPLQQTMTQLQGKRRLTMALATDQQMVVNVPQRDLDRAVQGICGGGYCKIGFTGNKVAGQTTIDGWHLNKMGTYVLREPGRELSRKRGANGIYQVTRAPSTYRLVGLAAHGARNYTHAFVSAPMSRDRLLQLGDQPVQLDRTFTGVAIPDLERQLGR